MSPRQPDPGIRKALIEAAATLLVEEGRGALSTRRLAAEVGTSTMAVYTHFKGMDELRHAVRREGFDRLAAYLREVSADQDALTEVVELGSAYVSNAIANPNLYRFMFMEKHLDDEHDVGIETFERLVAGVARAVDAGHFGGDPWQLALELWAATHGVLSLWLAGLLTLEEALESYAGLGPKLMLAMGADRDALDGAMRGAALRLGELVAGWPAAAAT